jgi:hypothetical protein
VGKMSFEVNNGRVIETVQFKHDGSISIIKYNSKGDQEADTFCISAGDFITMLNWYKYEKERGIIV